MINYFIFFASNLFFIFRKMGEYDTILINFINFNIFNFF